MLLSTFPSINSINENKNPKQDKQGGFTIVELLVVLGIGAAILVLALRFIPTLQKKNRDTARSSDVSQIVGAINGYITNNNSLPTAWSNVSGTIDDLSHYDTTSSVNPINSVTASTPATAGDFEDGPATAAFPVKVHTGTNLVDGAEDLIIIYKEAKCDATVTANQGTKVIDGGIRQMAIIYKLETNDLVACQNI